MAQTESNVLLPSSGNRQLVQNAIPTDCSGTYFPRCGNSHNGVFIFVLWFTCLKILSPTVEVCYDSIITCVHINPIFRLGIVQE